MVPSQLNSLGVYQSRVDITKKVSQKPGISLSPTGFQDVLKRILSDTMQKLEFHLIFGFGSKFKEGPQIQMSMFRINLMIIGVPNVDP